MEAEKKKLSLVDMDMGMVLSYELTSDFLRTRLFRIIPLKKIPLNNLLELRRAREEDISCLKRLKWFKFMSRHRTLLCPVYTCKPAGIAPRVYMRLARGSHIDMRKTMGGLDYETEHCR